MGKSRGSRWCHAVGCAQGSRFCVGSGVGVVLDEWGKLHAMLRGKNVHVMLHGEVGGRVSEFFSLLHLVEMKLWTDRANQVVIG